MSGRVVRTLAWCVAIYGLATFGLGTALLYSAVTSRGPVPDNRVLGVWLVAHVTLFTLLKVTVGMRVVDEHFRLMVVSDTVAVIVGRVYRVVVALTYCALLAILVGLYWFRPRFDSTGDPALLFLAGSLTGLSLLFVVCAVVGPTAVLQRPSDRPPLLYRLRRRYWGF
jgi:hypothetical protein